MRQGLLPAGYRLRQQEATAAQGPGHAKNGQPVRAVRSSHDVEKGEGKWCSVHQALPDEAIITGVVRKVNLFDLSFTIYLHSTNFLAFYS
jgi:hypothetical protein